MAPTATSRGHHVVGLDHFGARVGQTGAWPLNRPTDSTGEFSLIVATPLAATTGERVLSQFRVTAGHLSDGWAGTHA